MGGKELLVYREGARQWIYLLSKDLLINSVRRLQEDSSKLISILKGVRAISDGFQ